MTKVPNKIKVKMKLLLLKSALGFNFLYYDYNNELKKLSESDSAVYEDFYSDDYNYQYYFYDDSDPIKVIDEPKVLPTPKQPVAVPVAVPKPVAVQAPKPVAVAAPRPVVQAPKANSVAVPAPKPVARSNNYDYVYFGSGDGYEYYDQYYSDDLGSK